MYAAILCLGICNTPSLVPDRAPPRVDEPVNLESAWYDQLRRTGMVSIDLKDERIVISTKEIKDRKLILPTITRYDHLGQLLFKGSAKEAEIRFQAADRLLLLDVRDWNGFSPDGKTWQYHGKFHYPLHAPK